jgi:zinc finger protein
MSFNCEDCGFQNNEIQSGAEIKQKGIKLKLVVKEISDLNRRIVKSDYCAVRIDELDFEIPVKSQKGEVTTVEGIITRVISGLSQDQEKRKVDHPEAAAQIDTFIAKLEELKEVNKPFTLIIDDISGDAHIENPKAPHPDENVTVTNYTRTKEQDHMLGIFNQKELNEDNEEQREQDEGNAMLKPIEEGAWPLEELHGEVLQFQTNCPECQAVCETNMKLTTIPHFKDVVIMATVCDACGNRTNEVKSGGGIEEKGVKIEVSVTSRDDFSRDVLKSEHCHLALRELDVEVGPSALGGRFTTIEGLLTAMRDQLSVNSAMFGDSADRDCQDRIDV